ncbi:hypothetical protein RFI_32046 [Reticulomyxa filosa]|uniref:VWFA domain-containing protein n=1 Tax=Reticulomyxa filosa TaxID=46433 RepID=X6LX98_RETFI|nr:hypothetical protein RFI_32046 [Reticulomyxa filosa]|eukprot:ETO05350.1 hypothetical protein RFI_32046 [Reticulomyxa filosa]
MDATGSMSHLLQKVKTTVGTMFSRIAQILEDKGASSNGFEMQFVVYRNYNAPEDMILQVSPWEVKPDNLRNFMEMIESDYGMGNEAIEVGLAYVNRESSKQPRQQIRGEQYYYENELQLLKQNHIIVHAYFVDDEAETNFKEIADATGGRCEKLDINSPKGSTQLTDLVAEEVLRNAGGDKGDELVKAYRAKFLTAHLVYAFFSIINVWAFFLVFVNIFQHIFGDIIRLKDVPKIDIINKKKQRYEFIKIRHKINELITMNELKAILNKCEDDWHDKVIDHVLLEDILRKEIRNMLKLIKVQNNETNKSTLIPNSTLQEGLK